MIITRCLFVSNRSSNKMSVCKTLIPPYCHIGKGRGTVRKLISKELIGKYRCHLKKG